MACKRKGMGKGTGKKGYYNLIPKDKKVHSDSAKGRKQPQKIKSIPNQTKSYAELKKTYLDEGKHLAQGFYLDKDEARVLVQQHGKYPDYWVLEDMNKGVLRISKDKQGLIKEGKKYMKKKKIPSNTMPNQREILVMRRVPYGNAKTPIHLREYQISAGSPVGTIKEYEDFFKGQNVKLELGLTMKEKKKITKMAKLKDTDGDGVADILDCRPQDKTKQDVFEFEDVDSLLKPTKKSFGSSVKGSVAGIGKRLKELGSEGVSYISELNRANKEKKAKFKAEVANLNNKQLEDLAVRYKDDSLLGTNNPYEEELIRRINERNKIEQRIADAKQRAKERAEGKGGFF